MRKFTFIWFIHNYSYCWHNENEELESPTFFAEMIQQTSWNLHLYPRGFEDTDYITLFLKRCDNCNGPSKIALNYELSILDPYGRTLESTGEVTEEFKKYALPTGMADFFERPENILVDRAFTLDILRVKCTIWIGEGQVDKEGLSRAVTRIGLDKISFIKPIEIFSTLHPNREKTFDVTSASTLKLELVGKVLVKSELCSEDQVMVEISLDSPNAYLIACQIYELNSAGEEVEFVKIDTRNEKHWEGRLRSEMKLPKTNSKSELRFVCTLSTGIEYQKIEETFYDLHLTPLLKEKIYDANFTPRTSEPKSISGDLRSLYEDQILCDIEIKTASKSFPAHKSVLCARSPVFAQMLQTNMKEKLTDCIQITDLEDSTIDQFLTFLYSDILEDVEWESAMKLYYAADKYQVQRLKDVCLSFLITELNRKNMGDLMILADMYKDSDLEEAIQKFIRRSERHIFFTDEWESFMETNPKLAIKAMYFFLKNIRD